MTIMDGPGGMDADDHAGQYGDDILDSMNWLDDEMAGIGRPPMPMGNGSSIDGPYGADSDSDSEWEDVDVDEGERTEAAKIR